MFDSYFKALNILQYLIKREVKIIISASLFTIHL